MILFIKKSFSGRKNAGFTLLELLVVVLIIGILASVALPQYQKSVQKARLSRAVVTARNLYDAQQVYYLANGDYALKLEDLDLGFPNAKDDNIQSIPFTGGYCALNYDKKTVPERVGCFINFPATFYAIYLNNGSAWCCSYSSDNYKASGLCKSLLGGEGRDACSGNCLCWRSN